MNEEDDLPTLRSLMPILRPPSPRGPGARVTRLLFPGDRHSPLSVYYGHSLRRRNLYITPGHLVELGLSPEALEATCLRNWCRKHEDLNWGEIEMVDYDKPVMVIEGNDDLVGSILLAEGHLKGMHKFFDSAVIHLGLPDAYTVLVHSSSMPLLPLMEERYQVGRSQHIEFSPTLFASIRGQLRGYVPPREWRAEME